MPVFPAVLELSSLNGGNGFRIDGSTTGDVSGESVASAGDINGDGYSDLIIGAPLAGLAGSSYVVFGKDPSLGGFDPTLSLSSLDGSNGFEIIGETVGLESGGSVASAGDVNGDGFDDLIIGSQQVAGVGASHVVFGKAGGFAAHLLLSDLDGTNGFRIQPKNTVNLSSTSVASAGDFNGDGYADLIIGVPLSDDLANNAGASYVIFGKAGGLGPDLDLSALDGKNGFEIVGSFETGLLGFSVNSAGDFNADGFDDLIIAAPGDMPGGIPNGASYLVFGKASGFAASYKSFDLAYAITGDSTFEADAPFSVASAGDVNGDGFADVIIGVHGADTAAKDSGASYVVFGKPEGLVDDFSVSSLNGTNGFQINGETESDFSGASVASAGDFNGDGFDDLIIGARYADPYGKSSGASYVVFGKAKGFAANLNLSALNGTNGFQINGVGAGDRSGGSVAAAGDVNGDGFDDLIIGASYADPYGKSNAGASYVVFGQANGTLNRIGTDSGDILSGGDWDDTFDGAGGDDWIRPGGGDDIVIGGAGEDKIDGGDGDDEIRGGSGADDIDGGAGEDTIRMGSGDDSVKGTDDQEYVNGGSGFDAIDYSGLANAGLYVHLGQRVAIHANLAEQTLVSIESVTATDGDDEIAGNHVANVLIGKAGADIIFGGGGDDLIQGGNGADQLDGGEGNDSIFDGSEDGSADTVLGGLGNDMLYNTFVNVGGLWDGGEGTDTISFEYDPYVDAFFINMSSGAFNLFGTSFESFENLTGHQYMDVITGSDGVNVIDGQGGDDTIRGGGGADQLQGGLGTDTLSHQGAADGVTINLLAKSAAGGEASGDVFEGFENVTGGNGNDSLTGDAGLNTLDGQDGNDTILGGNGADVLIGGLGVDTLSYLGALTGVNINLSTGGANSGDASGDTFEGFENVTGSNGLDKLTGDAGKNALSGFGGKDILKGGNGADVLSGGAGGDALFGGLGTDILIGGGDADNFVFLITTESPATVATSDRLKDFTVDVVAGTGFMDRIDISFIDANAGTADNDIFAFIGGAAFTAVGQIRAYQSGGETIVELNTTDPTKADMLIRLEGFNATNLESADFIL